MTSGPAGGRWVCRGHAGTASRACHTAAPGPSPAKSRLSLVGPSGRGRVRVGTSRAPGHAEPLHPECDKCWGPREATRDCPSTPRPACARAHGDGGLPGACQPRPWLPQVLPCRAGHGCPGKEPGDAARTLLPAPGSRRPPDTPLPAQPTSTPLARRAELNHSSSWSLGQSECDGDGDGDGKTSP